jgi:Mce-associated membrane protein
MEGDAGTSQLNPTEGQERIDPGPHSDADAAPDDADATPDEESIAASQEEQPETQLEPADDRRPARLGIGWAVSICAVLVLLAAGLGAGGYLALRSHADSEALARDEAAALQAARDCVTATQAPDTAAMVAAQSKIIECATGEFGVQAPLYASVIADAYQASNAKVAVSDMRAAVEQHNNDGSILLMLAMRVKITNSQAADQEVGYRLRVRMERADGKYKIARLDQVSS